MANSEQLNRLEKDRLKDLNDRTVCITPHKFDKLPNTAALIALGFKFQSLVRNGKGHVISIIFEDLDSKRTAVKRLDGAICDGVRIRLNFDRKVVPVSEEELEDSRETNALAVHGVPFGWSEEELLKDFPKSEIGNPLTKEGTVFLKYRQSQHAIQDFIRNDHIQIQGKNVTVMFSHQRGFLRPYKYRKPWESRREVDKSPSSDRDLRAKINNNHERKWTELVWYLVDTTSVGETDFKSLMDILDLSELNFDVMQSKVEICRSSDFEKRVKLEWMDCLVQGFIKRENLPGAVVKEQPRGWARDLVEAAWRFFSRRSPKRSSSSSSDDAHSTRGRKETNSVFKRPRRVSPSSSSTTRSSSSDSRCSRSSRTDQNDNLESKSQDVEEPRGSTVNREEDMAKYLDTTLKGVGIPKAKAEKATTKIVTCLTEVVDKVQKSTVTSSEIARLLESVGYKSSHVTAHLAAELVINYMLREAQRPEESKETKSRKLPANLLEVQEGFPRMAVVMAYYLHTRMDNSEDESKDLAKSMVETWIRCRVDYSRLHHICLSDQRTASKQVLLHEILVQNSPTDLNMNMFQLSTMIDLTIRYFYRAVKG